MYQIIGDIWIKVTDFVDTLGYVGIFFMTFIEGTFVPIPSEITLIPAGSLAAGGNFNFVFLMITSVCGTLCGALFNYFIAYRYGRKIIIKYGKYIFFTQKKLYSIEMFFNEHGSFSVFLGRIFPGLKHFISFPAGLARMSLKTFCLYSAIGATLWCFILILIGYIIGENQDAVSALSPSTKYQLVIGTVVFVLLSLFIYIFVHMRRKKVLENVQVQNLKKDIKRSDQGDN